MTYPAIVAASLGVGLFAWCTVVVISALRSDRRREQASLATLQAALEASLRDLHTRRARS